MGFGQGYPQGAGCGLSSKKPQKSATKTVTAGRKASLTGPVVNVPVWRASTHLYENVAELEAGQDLRDLLRIADERLYRAKQQGRNRLVSG